MIYSNGQRFTQIPSTRMAIHDLLVKQMQPTIP